MLATIGQIAAKMVSMYFRETKNSNVLSNAGISERRQLISGDQSCLTT